MELLNRIINPTKYDLLAWADASDRVDLGREGSPVYSFLFKMRVIKSLQLVSSLVTPEWNSRTSENGNGA